MKPITASPVHHILHYEGILHFENVCQRVIAKRPNEMTSPMKSVLIELQVGWCALWCEDQGY